MTAERRRPLDAAGIDIKISYSEACIIIIKITVFHRHVSFM